MKLRPISLENGRSHYDGSVRSFPLPFPYKDPRAILHKLGCLEVAAVCAPRLAGGVKQGSLQLAVELASDLRDPLVSELAKERRGPVVFKDPAPLFIFIERDAQRRVEGRGEPMPRHLGQQFDGFCTSVIDVADHDFGAAFRKREGSRSANSSAGLPQLASALRVLVWDIFPIGRHACQGTHRRPRRWKTGVGGRSARSCP